VSNEINPRKHPSTLTTCAALTMLLALSTVAIKPLVVQGASVATIPSQIMTAKTVFLANAGEEDNGLSEQAYASLYQSLQQVTHYQLVPTSAAADLVLELHYMAPPNIVTDGSSNYSFRFRLVVIDRESHATLWSVTEFLDTNGGKIPFEQAFQTAIERTAGDVKLLSAGQLPSTNSQPTITSRKRH
jgi:hypothetical protein